MAARPSRRDIKWEQVGTERSTGPQRIGGKPQRLGDMQGGIVEARQRVAVAVAPGSCERDIQPVPLARGIGATNNHLA